MSYTVDVSNTLITLDQNTTESNLSGLVGLTDGTNPIVTVSGGDLNGNDGEVKVYTVKNPYRIRLFGTLTISPEVEMLFMENTVEVYNSPDFNPSANCTLIINGKFVESWGTWYSKNTWIRFNRKATSSFDTRKGLMDFHAKATVTWEGGLSAGYGVIGVQGSTSVGQNKPKLLSNATHSGLHTNMFSIHRASDITFDNFSVIGNRFVDNRENVTITDYTCTNSLLEGGSGQTYINYEGNTDAVSWNRKEAIRTFTNSKAGMDLNITPWYANNNQRGGQTTLRKSGIVTVVDKDKTALSGAKVSIRTYDDGGRLDWTTLNYGTDNEHARYFDQTSVVNLTGSSDANGEFPFNAIMKQITQRATFTVTLTNVVGDFYRDDNVVYTSGSTSAPAVVTYYDGFTKELYLKPSTNKYATAGGTVVNQTHSGSGTIASVANSDNTSVRYTKGASDSAQLQDCVTISYLQGVSTTELDYDGKFALETNVFKLPDPFIENKNATQVAAYTTLETTNKIYDALLLYLFNNWLQEDATICTFSGGFLDFGTNTVVLSATQVAPISKVGSTYSLGIGSGRFVGNLKAASITLIDGARTAGIIDSGGTITLPLRVLTLTGLQSNTEVRVFEAGTVTELAGVEASGTTFTDSTIGVNSVDIVIHHVDYVYIKLQNVATTVDLALPIQQQFDRGYRND